MQKKAHLTLKVEPGETAAVKVGDSITVGDILIKAKSPQIYEFNLGTVLNLTPVKAMKLLTQTPGKQLEKGTVIARKQGFLKKQLVKTPVAGTLVVVDGDKSLVAIKQGEESAAVTAWFDGVVAQIMGDKIIFEVTGTVKQAKSGSGKPISGKLLVIENTTNAFGLPLELEGCILTIKTATSDLIAKADTLGAAAIIAEMVDEPPFALPFLLLEDIGELVRYNHKTVIVNGDEKELLIIEEKADKTPKPRKQ